MDWAAVANNGPSFPCVTVITRRFTDVPVQLHLPVTERALLSNAAALSSALPSALRKGRSCRKPAREPEITPACQGLLLESAGTYLGKSFAMCSSCPPISLYASSACIELAVEVGVQ